MRPTTPSIEVNTPTSQTNTHPNANGPGSATNNKYHHCCRWRSGTRNSKYATPPESIKVVAALFFFHCPSIPPISYRFFEILHLTRPQWPRQFLRANLRQPTNCPARTEACRQEDLPGWHQDFWATSPTLRFIATLLRFPKGNHWGECLES